MRTINESKTFVKIEYSENNKIYMITSFVIEYDSKSFVIELVKDIMKTGIIEDVDNMNEYGIYDYIKEKNMYKAKKVGGDRVVIDKYNK